MKNLVLLLLIGSLAFTACNKENDQNLEVAKTQWENLAAQKYSFIFSVSCECSGTNVVPAKIVVEDNVITEILDVNTGEDLVFPNTTDKVINNIPSTFKTITSLFSEIENAIADADADVLGVEYDDTNGFPTSISIDWIRNADDDEISYTASNFQKIN